MKFFISVYYIFVKKENFFFLNLLTASFLVLFLIFSSYHPLICVKLMYYYFYTYPTFNIFSLVLLFLAVYFVILIITISDNKLFNFYYIIFIITFPLISNFYVFTDNLILFFYLYELFLLPSIFLVYYLSPNKRSTIATFYFLIWTQLGSFCVFLAIMQIIFYSNV